MFRMDEAAAQAGPTGRTVLVRGLMSVGKRDPAISELRTEGAVLRVAPPASRSPFFRRFQASDKDVSSHG
eukprot:11864434-Alexandrium_andersonii.AAC.1